MNSPTYRLSFIRSSRGTWEPILTPLKYFDIETTDPRIELAWLTLGFREAFAGESTVSTASERLRQLSTPQIVNAAAWLDAAMRTYDGPTDRRAQSELSRFFFGASDPLPRVKTNDRRILFQNAATLNLLKLALLLGCQESSTDSLVPFGEALLMMNDIMDSAVDNIPRDAPNFTEQVELYVFANMSAHTYPAALGELARAYDLFLTPRPDLPDFLDIPELIERATGLPVDDVLMALHGLWALFLTIDVDAINRGEFVVDKRHAFAQLNVSDAELDKFASLAGRTLDEHRQLAAATYRLDSLRPFDVRHFERFPLIAIGDKMYCVSHRHLERLMTMGLQRFATDAALDESEVNRFHRHKGHLFEDYVCRSLVRSHEATRVLDGARIRLGARKEPHCDAAVLVGDSVLLFECKASAPVIAARANESWEHYLKFLHAVLLKSAKQLHFTRLAIAEGRYVEHGLNPKQIRRYYCISAALDLAITPLTFQHVVELVKASSFLQSPDCATVQLYDVHDIEALERAALAGEDVAALLLAKTSDHQTESISFTHFARRLRRSWAFQHNAYLSQQSAYLHNRIRAHMEKRRRCE